MTNDELRSLALATMHVDAVHEVCAGVEKVVDARVAASVYIARAGRILATLRKHKLTNRDEIEQLSELLVEQAMTDKAVVAAHDVSGAPILAPEEKAKVN